MKRLEITKKGLKDNIEIIKNISPETQIIAVVKSNGMGLDLIKYSRFLVENGITYLAVANLEEAIELRKAKIECKILMLTPIINKNNLQLLIDNDITLTIGSQYEYNLLKECIKEKYVNIHIKIDTGFGRYGIKYNEDSIYELLEKNEFIKVEGIYTHFSKPDDEKWTRIQFNRFIDVIEKLKKQGYNPELIHCAASTAFLKYPEMRLKTARIGSAFQGRTLIKNTNLVKIGKFKSNIIEIKKLSKGYNISYGNTYKTKKDTLIAVIPVGYMDGLNKNKLRDDFSFKNNLISVGMEIKKIFKDNSIKVKINNQYFNIIGRLGMYHAIIDITDSKDLNIGEEVQLDITPLQTNDIIRREYI